MEGTATAMLDDFVVGGSLMHSADTEVKPDFSGYATKAGLKCTDGRTIMPDAFKHQDQATVPLVWQHAHSEVKNVLGHAILENRDDGVYCYGYFNDTDEAKHAKVLVQHKDIDSLSIFANELKERALSVFHGVIREVSLVLARANPGAKIDNIALQHGDGITVLDDEAIIYTGLELEHEDKSDPSKGDDDGQTIQEVYDGMSEEQKSVVHFMVGEAMEANADSEVAAAHAALPTKTKPNDKSEKEIQHMSRNVFDRTKGGGGSEEEQQRHVLSHDAVRGIVRDAVKTGSLKAAVEGYALEHGIDNIDILFPDAKAVDSTPEFDKRRTEWVAGVLGGTRKSPFSRIKSLVADITHDEARAKGYIKGTLKKEEYFQLSKRVTTPTTVYKKQKLDRDDILDITDLDVVAWMKGEMRLMWDEETARAILIGDGRDVDDEDKIKDPAGAYEGAGVRSIANDHDLYAATITVPAGLDTDAKRVAFVERVLLDMKFYKGSGEPTFYSTLDVVNNLLLTRDGMGRRLYRTRDDLATEMGVANIVTVEVMEDAEDLAGIIVNLKDYTIGTDRGGEGTMFEDFDIDYNQHKYLYEGRASGALTKIRSALVLRFADADDDLVAPEAPLFDDATGEIVINDTAGVVYKRDDTGAVVNTAGSPYVVAPGDSLKITSEPAAGFYFENNVDDEWTFDRPAA